MGSQPILLYKMKMPQKPNQRGLARLLRWTDVAHNVPRYSMYLCGHPSGTGSQRPLYRYFHSEKHTSRGFASRRWKGCGTFLLCQKPHFEMLVFHKYPTRSDEGSSYRPMPCTVSPRPELSGVWSDTSTALSSSTWSGKIYPRFIVDERPTRCKKDEERHCRGILYVR